MATPTKVRYCIFTFIFVFVVVVVVVVVIAKSIEFLNTKTNRRHRSAKV
jgi:hypothetical protein